MKLNNKIARKLRKNFPILKKGKLSYLDSAATTQKPREVIDSMTEFYENSNANVGRGIYSLSQKATEEYEGARKTVAEFINAEPEEIIFTKSTTDSLNMLAHSLEIFANEKRNEIVLTEMEHHSNLIPWQQLAKRKNLHIKFIKMKSDFTLDLEDAKSKITDSTAIVSLTHISNSFGTINPVAEITKLSKKKGAVSVVDAAQSAGHMKISVRDLGCDFLAFSGHKMLAPTGIGVLYGRKELLEKISPSQFGGGMIKKVEYDMTIWNEIPHKFEAGTQNISGAIALGEAIKYLNKIGMENISEWEEELTKHALEKLMEIKGIRIYAARNSTGIISFTLENAHPHDIAYLLDGFGIAVRAGHHCTMPIMKKLNLRSGTVRISFSIYNTFEDIDKLVKALNKINTKFGK